ncbi:MAG: CoA-binding protein, partial [Deltaproteobacteria bacterium]|nr:CoA-binding protein [Deltaproteobacteria bacterium]
MESLSRLDAIFKPRSVALIGASATPGKLGYDVLYNLIHAGFSGPIYPVNPKVEELLGLRVYKSISEILSPPDLAVIIIPAKAVPGTLQQCGEAGIKAAIVVTGGFAEAGEEGEKLQEELAAMARRYSIRVIGPNCQGVNNPHHRLCASWPLLTTKGGMAFICQSGTVGAAIVDWASQEQLGVSVFVSLGNRADVDESDAIRYFNRDPHTKVIALYVEGVKRPAKFLEALAEAKKPIVILKSGRTARGRVAAESHTKSLAGSDEIYNAIFEKYKVHRADTLEELYDYSKALAYLKKPSGRRLLNISSSGGAAILAIDEAEKYGFSAPAPSKKLHDRLRTFLPAHCGVNNPIDLTGDAISDPSLYSRVMEASRSEYDAMVLIFGDPIHGASDIVSGKGELVIFCGGADVEREESRLMHKKGVPVYFTPERGMKALCQLFRFDQDTRSGDAPHEAPP